VGSQHRAGPRHAAPGTSASTASASYAPSHSGAFQPRLRKSTHTEPRLVSRGASKASPENTVELAEIDGQNGAHVKVSSYALREARPYPQRHTRILSAADKPHKFLIPMLLCAARSEHVSHPRLLTLISAMEGFGMAVTWKNDAARSRLELWFDRFRDRIPGSVETREVPTRYGPNQVLLAGRTDGPPLVCLHAMRTGSAFLVPELDPLLERFRVVAPDLPGQSVRGLQVKLPLGDDSHARWLGDVLDGLGLGAVNLFGVSWGGFVARQAASVAQERVRRLALLVPAGIANGSHWKGLTKMALPMIRYRVWRSERNLRRLLDPLFTTWDPDWAGFTGAAIRDMPFDFRIPPLATDDELRRLTMPVLVLGAAEDISFPGEAVVRRVRAIVPHAEGEVIAGCKHCPPTTPEFRGWLAAKLAAFFEL
jgi:2-hydroxy-6-oxonona-2,4-dienedioate hydrolase